MLRRALVVIAAAPVMGNLISSCGGGEVSCSGGGLAPAQLATRSAVHYTEHGSQTRQCSLCQLYTGTPEACGTCSVVPGSINPHGSCDAFVART